MTPLTSYRDDGPIIAVLARLTGARAGSTRTRSWGAPVVIAASGCLLVAVMISSALSSVAAAAAAFVLVVALAAGSADASRWAWLVPAAVRAAEFAVIIRVSQLYPEPVDVQTGAFLLVIALHYYDVVYRQRMSAATTAGWVRAVAGGWEVRLLVICAVSLTTALPWALTVGASVLGALFVVDAAVFWSGRSVSPAR